jgi:hypothetical protein
MAALLLVIGCTKISSTEIGVGLIPAVDNINTFDTTLELTTENFAFTDSAFPRLSRTTTGGAPELLAGYIGNDPQFGRTTASMFFFLSPPQFPAPYEVKDSLYLDSVVLCLRWSGQTYGDTGQLQKFEVFKLASQLRPDSSYRTDVEIPYKQFLGSRSFVPFTLKDSISLFRQKVARQLRIRLSDDFGREILAWDTAGGQPLGNDTSFRKALPGFALIPDVAGSANALMGYLISDTNSYLRIYYRYDTASKRDTTFRTYKYVVNGGFANRIIRQYSGSEFSQTLGAGADSIVYIQNSPGTYSILRIPSLQGFKAKKGNVVINRAELVMQQVPSVGQSDEIFTPPPLLYLDYYDSLAGIQKPFLSDAFSGSSYSPIQFGGIQKKVTGPGGVPVSEYRFAISRYVQGIITKNNYNNPIYLYSPYYIRYSSPILFQGFNSLATGRVKLGGGSNKRQKMYLRIIYSKI